MAEYIDKAAFIADKRKQYCADCDRRKGMKNGKVRFVYDIGDAPCRACGIGDMLDEVEDYPAADVVEIKHGHWISTLSYKGQSVCSVCGFATRTSFRDTYWQESRPEFCPHCMAVMDESEGKDNG